MKVSARIRQPSTFIVLMLAAAVVALLPARWTRWTSNLVQPLAWLQWALTGGTRAAVDNALAQPLGTGVPVEEYERLRSTVTELELQVRHQQLALGELAQRIEEVTGLRDQLRDDATRIILGTVIGGGTATARETLTVSPGALRGVAAGQWVVAGRGLDEAGDITGRELVTRGWIIGRISDARNHLSTVQLCSDLGFGPVEVRLARQAESGPELAPTPCILDGAGGGRMVIRQATADYYASGHTAVVIVRPGPIPVVLTVGIVTGSQARSDSPLHYDLDVAPVRAAREVRHVYILASRVDDG